MAHVFVGNRVRINEEAMATVRSLPDTFWAYAEFNINRNIDWLIVRYNRDQPTLFILTETKVVSRLIRGTDNGPWEQQTEMGDWQAIQPSNRDDANYYWQAVNTANELKYWLWLNQPRYREAGSVNRPQEDFNVWPDVLLLGPPDLRHQLPLKPSSGFGLWLYSTDSWKQQLMSWRPKPGIVLTEQELDDLGRAFNLEQLPSEPQPVPLEYPALSSPLVPLAEWMGQYEDRLSRMEMSIRSIESQLSSLFDVVNSLRRDLAVEGTSPRETRPMVRAVVRPLSAEESNALVAAVEALAQSGRNRTFPSVLSEIGRFLPYQLKDTNYNQFGTAKAFFEQAAADGIIRLEGIDSLHPTVWLPHEIT